MRVTISCFLTMLNKIIIRGARQHNLKKIDLDIPRNQLVVITGLSGSGKSTLAFDTLYAEGQRRYVESLSTFARQLLERMEKPDVDLIDGLSPAIAIDRKSAGHNPRSTVGTVTEIYDYLRLLFARVGTVRCHLCKSPIAAQSVDEMVDGIMQLPSSTKIILLAPIVYRKEGRHTKAIKKLRKDGFARIRVNSEIREIEAIGPLPASTPHSIEVVVDRLVLKPNQRNRLTDSLELALSISKGTVLVDVRAPDDETVESLLQFSEAAVCPQCDIRNPELTPASFSFNSPHGACPACSGLGTVDRICSEAPGSEPEKSPCTSCDGSRLRAESRAVTISGMAIHELTRMSITEAATFFRQLAFDGQRAVIAEKIKQNIIERLEFLAEVGLPYLSLDRTANTLSGGENQRIRLATQIGAKLTGVLYVLDEPSIGLHPRDTQKLRQILLKMRDLGNTMLVVEHDPDTIMKADWVIDMGPGAGSKGGEVVFTGPPQSLIHSETSITGKYLSGRLEIPIPHSRRPGNGKILWVRDARHHNLKGIDVAFPLGCLICVTGVSGSGKSSLVTETLYTALSRHCYPAAAPCSVHAKIEGEDHIDRIVHIDQSPIGRTPRSNPGTYTGTLFFVRDLFAKTPDSRMRGFKPGRFSSNVKGGRCEACKGDGVIRIEMHFLPDIYVPCDLCQGKCYNRETLEIRYKGKNIADVLDMTVNQAWTFFNRIAPIRDRLQTLIDVGLGYLHLGQPSTTLSGGEAQRVKLARELSKRGSGHSLYILDEPTTGLHMEDIHKLLLVINRLVDSGNTVIIIEHNLDVIKTADQIIDLGPEGGDGGGHVIGTGTPEDLTMHEQSYTGQYLRNLFKL